MEFIIEILKLVTALLGLAGAAVALMSKSRGNDSRYRGKGCRR